MDKARHTRVVGLVFVAGCYLPGAGPESFDPPREERGMRTAHLEETEAESESKQRSEGSAAQPIQVRNVKAEAPKKPEMASVGITISIPTVNVDCADVLLSVVGARHAVLGERVVLTAAWSGPVGVEESDDEAEPALLWADSDMMTNLTVTGPATAEVLCDSLGLHEIRVELAPPAPCPATLQVEVECVERAAQ